MIETSGADQLTIYRIDPENANSVQVRKNQQGKKWETMATYASAHLAREVMFAMRRQDNQELIDLHQRKPLKLPKGDIRLNDGRSLRRIIGYDLTTPLIMDEKTASNIVASAGWRHQPTGLIITAGIENTPRWGPLLHVSMSYADHLPAWEDIKAVREAFFPLDIDTAMILPRESDYVNVHPYCLHVWQIPQEWGMR